MFEENYSPKKPIVTSLAKIPDKKFNQTIKHIVDVDGQFMGKLFLNGDGTVKLWSKELRFYKEN
mgnify:CR=1 FL=1|tara:strand:+ start:520 stop:711 length:192 start_codon:yes stop_codon:yes gene_type:complete